MGCGPLLRRQTACTNVTANLRSKRAAFHTPSVTFGDTFPASQRRVAPGGRLWMRLDDHRLHRLVRQSGPIMDRTFTIQFL